jgi:hypothetical protein
MAGGQRTSVAMGALRPAAGALLVLVLVAIVLSVLTDPYFNRFSAQADGLSFERDGASATRPLWRVPAVAEPLPAVATTLRLLLILEVFDVGTDLLVPMAPFIPPRR